MDQEQNPFIPDYDDNHSPAGNVFKYLSPERIDVIQNNCIRFTPLMSTNDVFEVRRTFKSFAGPKFRDALLFEMRAQKLDEAIRAALVEAGFPASIVAGLSRNVDLIAHLRRQMNVIVDDIFMPSVNSDEFFEEILFRFGGKSVALSLTEDDHNSVMWAHYAGNSAGFVLEFDSNNHFLKLNLMEIRGYCKK